VGEQELNDRRRQSDRGQLHKCLRIAALLHDIGTFPFSHAVELAYLKHGNDRRRAVRDSISGQKTPKNLPNSHEHLGAFIIKNTDFEGGITRILKEYRLDIQLISQIIKGESPFLIANQLMHSDLDADRMDYLLRDSHHTGIKYGLFDRDYLLANLAVFPLGKDSEGREQHGFGVRENALHAVEDFLIARFGWYSQVIRNHDSAKFDILAASITKELLNQDLMVQFSDLLEMIESRDERFFFWNDVYWMSKVQEVYSDKKLNLKPKKNADELALLEKMKMILFRNPPKSVKDPLFRQKLIKGDSDAGLLHSKKVLKRLKKVENFVERLKTPGAWVLAEIPRQGIKFTASEQELKLGNKGQNVLFARDPVKIVRKNGKAELLIQRDDALIKSLSQMRNFVPAVYANEVAYRALKSAGLSL
jgi:HD superfamily phosphohydrolase